MDKKDRIIIFCDGACSGNPGPGGWGAIIAVVNKEVWEIGGGEEHTTNNRMELLAAISALELIEKIPGKIEFHSDSNYVIQGMKSWIHGWKRNGWMNKEKKAIANPDLWQRLDEVAQGREITWNHVAAHSGIAPNERVDRIAVAYSQKKGIELYRGDWGGYSIPLI